MEKSPLKAIRAKCLDCCCGQASEVKIVQASDVHFGNIDLANQGAPAQ